MLMVVLSLVGRGVVIPFREQGCPVCGGSVRVQVTINLSNILSNTNDDNIEDHCGPVKTVTK